MDAERAVPILERVMARRDAGSTCLRRRAVFMLSQKRTSRTEATLLDAIGNDPDAEVREQAVFWLGQSGGPRAAAALDSILRTSTDAKIQVKAIFSLAQMNQAAAGPTLRNFAGRADASREVRDQAVFWLGQSANAENAQFLRDLYRRERDEGIKERILFSVSQNSGERAANATWLAGIAANPQEPIKLRKNALFWAGQSGAPLGDLIRAYDQMPDREMKEQVIFVLSQRSEREATDKLIDIVRTEREPKLRERAIFWVSQRNDPRVPELLMGILERRPPA
jgi:HEAT repeat protein